jgi:uncharacterized membrane protein
LLVWFGIKMTEFLFARPSFWQGFGCVLDLGGTWFESNRSATPAQADRIAMKQDWIMVGNEGPLPAPEVLFQYNEIIPGGADRILKMVEVQSAHRQALETLALNHEIKSGKFGQWGALVIALVGIAAGSYAVYKGAQVAAGIIAGGAITAIATAYLTGTLTRSQERKQKAKMMTGEGEGEMQVPKVSVSNPR